MGDSMHALIAPSFLEILVPCPGALALSRSVPPLAETEETKEGDAAHWLALEYSEGRRHPLGTVAPNGIEIDADMIYGAELWCATVGVHGMPEMPTVIQRIHETECWGTPDRRRFEFPGPRTALLTVWDYKYGHKYVDPFENWQLIAYIAGSLDELQVQGYQDTDVLVDCAIVQPRSYHKNGAVQHWRKANGQLHRGSDLRALINVAYMAAHEALKPNAPTKTGPHCLYCPARHVCTTAQHGAMNIAEFSGTSDRTELQSAALGTELTILENAAALLKARITGLQAQAESMLRMGYTVPGYGMEPGQSRLKWKLPPGDTIAQMEAMGYDVRKPQDVITATQARDRFKIDEAVMAIYSDRPPGAMKLSKSSTTEARKVFGT